MSRYNKDDLERLILVERVSYAQIGRIYGVGGNAVKKAAKKMGIPVTLRRRINEKENFSHKGKRMHSSYVNRVDNDTFSHIINTSTLWKEIGEKLGYKSFPLGRNVKKSIEERCELLNLKLKIRKPKDVSAITKKELFKSTCNWFSARATIVKNARFVFDSNGKERKCAICGYDKHIEIAHIKSVASFDEYATIGEINSADNLIALCPNHHWEYDNGLLSLE